MLSKVEFNNLFKPAMQLAFGKTLICRNQDVCSQFSKSHDMDTITLEGRISVSNFVLMNLLNSSSSSSNSK